VGVILPVLLLALLLGGLGFAAQTLLDHRRGCLRGVAHRLRLRRRRTDRQPSGALVPSLMTPTVVRRGETAPTSRPVLADTDDEGGDHLRHIVCMICYPAFDQALEAPHDAVCLCGKRLLKGDKRGAGDAAQCILCNELRDHHYATAHADK